MLAAVRFPRTLHFGREPLVRFHHDTTVGIINGKTLLVEQALLPALAILAMTTQSMTAALAAGRRSLDWVGVCLAALGGASVRDVLLGHYPLIVGERALAPAGLVVFTITRCEAALDMSQPLPIVIIAGMVTGCVGGDVLCNEVRFASAGGCRNSSIPGTGADAHRPRHTPGCTASQAAQLSAVRSDPVATTLRQTQSPGHEIAPRPMRRIALRFLMLWRSKHT